MQRPLRLFSMMFLIAVSVMLLGVTPGALRKPGGVFKHSLVRAKIAEPLLGPSIADPDLAWLAPWREPNGGLDAFVEIDVSLAEWDEALIQRLVREGLQIRAAFPRYRRLVGVCRTSLLTRLAGEPNVLQIEPNRRPVSFGASNRFSGQVENQAARFIGVNLLEEQGTGTKIGIISNSFRSRLQGRVREAAPPPSEAPGQERCRPMVFYGSEPQARDELPSEVFLLDNGPLRENDEGRAMAELIHDLAPQAELYFHSGSRSLPGFAEAIRVLSAECGVDVIVDDLLYPQEPMFQDGLIAEEIAQAVERGTVYVTAAGNLFDFGVSGMVRGVSAPSAFPADSRNLHVFADSGNPFARIELPRRGCGVQLVLQWAEPFSGVQGAGAASDLDLYLCASPRPEDCVRGSARAQGCGVAPGVRFGDPVEILAVVNASGSSQTRYMAIDRYCGEEDVPFRIVAQPIGCDSDTGETDVRFFEDLPRSPQIYGHGAAGEAISTAAVHYLELERQGAFQGSVDAIEVDPYSSLGGRIVRFFDSQGQPLPQPAPRFKPDLTAPDGVNTSFFSRSAADVERDGHPNYPGTSAAAAQVAAVAALVLEAGCEETRNVLPDILRSAACGLGDWSLDVPPSPCPEAPGFDPREGYGLVNALAAVAEAKRRCDGPQPLGPGPLGVLNPVELRWSAVASAEFYQVELARAGSEAVESWQRIVGERLEAGRLQPAVTYRWRVRAALPGGLGRWSDWSEFQTASGWSRRR